MNFIAGILYLLAVIGIIELYIALFICGAFLVYIALVDNVSWLTRTRDRIRNIAILFLIVIGAVGAYFGCLYLHYLKTKGMPYDDLSWAFAYKASILIGMFLFYFLISIKIFVISKKIADY